MNNKENLNKLKNPLILDILESFISSFVILFLLYLFLAFPEVVSGASMEPTLHDGERILVEKVTKHFKEFKRGDIIVFHPPSRDRVDYVKRVVGVPGDVVKISGCNVYITNEGSRFVLEEPYLYEDICTYPGPYLSESRSEKIREGEYLVLGDNRTKSADSRFFGLVKKDRIVGEVVFRFWPVSKLGLL